MKKTLLVALFAVPIFISSAFASPLPTSTGPVDAEPVRVGSGDEYIRPIRYLGPELPPLNLVTAADFPVPASSMGIGPGSPLLIALPEGLFGCTANFIWTSTESTTTTSKRGQGKGAPNDKAEGNNTTTTTTSATNAYLGSAGHCFLPGGSTPTDRSDDATSTHGPDADFDPALATVYVCVDNCEFGGVSSQLAGFVGLDGDFIELGRVAYARQSRGGALVGEDFGIVEIQPENDSLIRPQLPVWGGPASIEDVTLGGPVCVYGNAVGFGEVFLTKARAGVGRGVSQNQRSWIAELPSASGDSGSALVTCEANGGGVDGRGAAGVLTHISPGQAAIVGTTTGQAARMALHDAGIGLQLKLADGTSITPELAPEYPPPPDSPEADGSIDLDPATVDDETYEWGPVGPFSRLEGQGCDGQPDPEDPCDYEFVQVTVPEEDAILTVGISADIPAADFDLYVFGPSGNLVGSSGNPLTIFEEVSERVDASGVYTIAVDPFTSEGASYSGSAELSPAPPAPPPPPPPPPISGDPHIYQAGVIDPFVLTELFVEGSYTVVPGTFVDLSVRFMRSSDPSIKLEIDPETGVANFEAVHVIKKDGEVAFGPFAAEEGVETAAPGFFTNSTWDIPLDAELGTYVFEAFVTVNGVTYLVASLPFQIGFG